MPSPPIPRLGPRLAAVAELVPPGVAVADVGCDHGHLARHLLARGALRVVAIDRRPAPLSRAAALLEGCVGAELRLGEGLAPLAPLEVGAIVLAGMGGRTMARILAHHPERAGGAARLVLQPNRDAPLLRRALSELGWPLTHEAMVEDGGRLYPVLAADPRAPLGAPLSAADVHLGPILRRTRPPAFLRFLLRERARLSAALAAAGTRPAPALRYELELVEAELSAAPPASEAGADVSRTSARKSRA